MKTNTLKVVVTGPESTGKSTLTEWLAKHYNTVFIPEYAREYVGNLKRSYQFEDIEHIARHQIEDMKRHIAVASGLLFIDTYLIITKVWFDVVYHCVPPWLDNAIITSDIDLYLLCNTDIPWHADGIRENGGEMRENLFGRYKAELEYYGFNYRIVSGLGDQRQANARSYVDEIINHKSVKF